MDTAVAGPIHSIPPPYSNAADSLFIAFYASAELGCHLSLGWPIPARILDLYVEFRNLTNGLNPLVGNSLLGALTYYGLDSIGAEEKAEMVALILRGPPWTKTERYEILDYCQSDVAALARLLPVMLPRIDLARALLRGRYMTATARMEDVGVPIDVPLFERLKSGWAHIQDRLITAVDADYGVYEGQTFKIDRFDKWLAKHNIPWPVLESGQLDLEDRTFRNMALTYPQVENLRQLRHALSGLRLNKLAVGKDGRNRCLLSAFRSKTSRNQPSNSQFIFGPSAWLRSLIKPPEGWAIAYLDWSAQEFGVAGALSRDPKMIEAYLSGDAYLAFAKQSKAAPVDATKKSHEKVRSQYKQGALSTMYGIEAVSLSIRLGIHPLLAQCLLEAHRDLYTEFWEWGNNAINHCLLNGWQETVFGWRRYLSGNETRPRRTQRFVSGQIPGSEINLRSLLNFWIQANSAEMMRLAACLGTEAGILVCAPVHDAFMIIAPAERIAADAAKMCACMREASRIVLNGFELRATTDAEDFVHYPNRYRDERGIEMWNTVMRLLDTL